jgi:hypothetical protein
MRPYINAMEAKLLSKLLSNHLVSATINPISFREINATHSLLAKLSGNSEHPNSLASKAGIADIYDIADSNGNTEPDWDAINNSLGINPNPTPSITDI